jgi:hypothetical protein
MQRLTFLDESALPFRLDPDRFVSWLHRELPEEIYLDLPYHATVDSMCEYACLYVSMLLRDDPISRDLSIYYGKFGTIYEHYWLGLGNLFIDLTLQQFDHSAPRLAITTSHNERVEGRYSYLSEPTAVHEYLSENRALEFYTDPITMIRPPKAIELQQMKARILEPTLSLSGNTQGYIL